MAPPAKINEEETGPSSTLPADFGEWDSGAPPTTLPDNFTDFDTAPKQPAKPAPKAAVSRTAARPPEIAPSRTQAQAYAETERSSDQPQSKRAKSGGDSKRRAEARPEARIETKVEEEDEGETAGKGKGKMVIIAIAAVLLLGLGILIPMNLRKQAPKTATPEQAVVQTPVAASLADAAKPKPTAATTTATATPAATTETATPAEATPAPVNSAAMQNQLNAQSRISIKTAGGGDAAPTSGFGSAGMEGMGNAGGAAGVFGSKGGPNVTAAPEAPKSLNVSGSVMAGRAISRSSPVYPSFARTARVEGTVVLHASISKAGTITNLSVISGPTMLRQAAVDAVKTWRYKPYLLNNEPVEVETTVNVTFVLAG